MNQEKLTILLNDKKLNKCSHYTESEKNQTALDFYHKLNHAKDISLTTVVEKISELTQILNRIKRKSVSTKSINLIEEIADVRLCFREINCRFSITATNKPFDSLTKDHSCELEIENASSNNNLDVLLMKYLSEITVDLCRHICDQKELTNITEKINKANLAIKCLIESYGLSMNDILYIEDIKIEDTNNKITQESEK